MRKEGEKYLEMQRGFLRFMVSVKPKERKVIAVNLNSIGVRFIGTLVGMHTEMDRKFRGVSICDPNDKFDPEIGATIAINRCIKAMRGHMEEQQKKSIKDAGARHARQLVEIDNLNIEPRKSEPREEPKSRRKNGEPIVINTPCPHCGHSHD